MGSARTVKDYRSIAVKRSRSQMEKLLNSFPVNAANRNTKTFKKPLLIVPYQSVIIFLVWNCGDDVKCKLREQNVKIENFKRSAGLAFKCLKELY